MSQRLSRLLWAAAIAAAAPAYAQVDAPVTVTQDAQSFILSNGYASATINKRSGDMTGLMFQGKDLMGHVSGHHAGYWEQSPANAAATVTIDPAKNSGERAEVSIKGAMGSATGNGAGMTLEIRYAMGKGEHGLYTYAIFSHEGDAPGGVGESRYGAKLNGQVFDWLSVDAQRNFKMPTGEDWDKGSATNMKEARRLTTGEFKGRVEHKYDYCVALFDSPAFGWASTKDKIGIYFINPSMEYLSGGPTHVELTCHLDDGDGGDPTMLDYWRGTHYGGTECSIAAGEKWSKVIGPILVYVNSGETPENLFKDANAQAVKEAKAWPYDWVEGVDYPHKSERATVTGRVQLRDIPGMTMSNVRVGLTAEEDSTERGVIVRGATERGGGRGGRGGGARGAPDWQHDAKNYQFWVRASDEGSFTIPNVRPGNYTLNAIADGVLGEFILPGVHVEAGKPLSLGSHPWTPVRYGQQVWEIGFANRNATEFRGGLNHWHWGAYLEYPKLFPQDVHYVVENSDFRKDWFFEQVPHNEDAGNTLEAGTGQGNGRATPWTIEFAMPRAGHGLATLRAAICGAGNNVQVEVAVNGKPAGAIGPLTYNATINRDGAQGAWSEHDVAFDGALLKAGQNTMTLTVPAGGLTNGVMYDYLRLEMDAEAPAPAAASQPAFPSGAR